MKWDWITELNQRKWDCTEWDRTELDLSQSPAFKPCLAELSWAEWTHLPWGRADRPRTALSLGPSNSLGAQWSSRTGWWPPPCPWSLLSSAADLWRAHKTGNYSGDLCAGPSHQWVEQKWCIQLTIQSNSVKSFISSAFSVFCCRFVRPIQRVNHHIANKCPHLFMQFIFLVSQHSRW